MFLPASCLILLHVDSCWLFVAFGRKVCDPESRAFSDETTFSPSLSDHSGQFDHRHAASAAGKIGCRADLRLSWTPSRRGPLHPSTAERRDGEEITAHLPRLARFQRPPLHSA